MLQYNNNFFHYASLYLMSYTHPTTKYATANNARDEIPALLFNNYGKPLKKYHFATSRQPLSRKLPV